MELSTLPPATARLAVELQLDDINAILPGLGSGDEYAAFEAMKQGFQDTLVRIQDRVVAMEVLRADHENRVAFDRLLHEERQARQDHAIARELDDTNTCQTDCQQTPTHGPLMNQDLWVESSCQPSEALISAMEEEQYIVPPGSISLPISTHIHLRNNSMATEAAANKAESSVCSTSKGKRKAKGNAPDEHVTHAICTACLERFARFDVLELDCMHSGDENPHAYCRTCLEDLVRTSLTDSTLFPPRCCGKHIPLTGCHDLCSPKLVRQYREKLVEMESPNPMYCSNRFCAKFLKPETIKADVAVCSSCKNETCAICRNPKHHGVCPEDPTVKMLLEVAGKSRWQRCYRCRTMVELLSGCYHMSCPCGGQFCYLCAKRWKTCSCTQWDENRLLSGQQGEDNLRNSIAMPEEEEVQEADPSLEVLEDMQLRLATVAGGFVIGDDDGGGKRGESEPIVGSCQHHWERAYGKYGDFEVCGICQHHLKFVNACTTCKTRVCNRCLNNRL